MASTDEYLLGHTTREWSRLEEQHALWGPILLGDLRQLGLEAGQRVLDVGCGTGTLLADLAAAVEPTGEAEGIEIDADSAQRARERLGDRALVHTGDLLTGTPDGPWDVIVARWVLSFLPDPAAVVAQLSERLAPGGRLVVFDYNHDGLGVWPRQPAIDEMFERYRAAYAASGGDLWVAAHLPGTFRAEGLTDVRVAPHVLAGPPGSPVWRWVERFVWEHLPTLREAGLWSDADHAALEAAWSAAVANPSCTLFTPIVATVSGQRPRED